MSRAHDNDPMRRTVLVLIASAAILGCGPADREPVDDRRRQDQPAARPGANDAGEQDQPAATPASQLTIHFSRGESTVAVSREAPADGGLEAALRHLVRGPTASERAAGLHSWFSDTTAEALRSVTVHEGGRAVVDFEDLRGLIPNASTSAGSAMLLRELNSTVFAIPSVRSVEYRIEGSCEQFWEWLQYGGCPVQERS